MMQPTVILLKEGTDTSQGRAQLVSNINACQGVVDILRTTLGPRGMDKLIYTARGDVTISNDGATVIRMLDIAHPAAKTLVEIARSQDEEVGDGTTSVVVLAGEMLKESKAFIEDGIHPTTVMEGFRVAAALATAHLESIAEGVVDPNSPELRSTLKRCAMTSLNSKLLASHREMFAAIVVDAVMTLDDDMDLAMIGVKKVKGGALEDSHLVAGVAVKKSFSYAGFEQQPKRFESPRIILLNVELELKAERDNAEIQIKDPARYQELVNAEWNVIYRKLDAILQSGAKVVFSRLAIGDLATQYFADHNVFCAGRVPAEDLARMARATGATVLTTTSDIPEKVLGSCDLFEERQVGGERYNFLLGCPRAASATILLRGGGEQFLAEAERSMHDAVMITRRMRKLQKIVGGGGAIEMQLSKHLREMARSIFGKQQLVVAAYAKALEVIPRTVADNAGFDSTVILNKLRQRHAQTPGVCWYGVDIENEDICDTLASFVWEPALVKRNALAAATEAACLILSIDETVKNPKSEAGALESQPAMM